MTLFAQNQGPVFDEWEAVAPALRRKIQRKRLEEYVAHAKQVPFYTERLSCFDPQADEPLADVLAVTPKELRRHLDADLEARRLGRPSTLPRLISSNNVSHSVFQSGGTTGKPKSSLFTHAELEGLNLPNARGYFAVGLTDTDRVANLWAAGGLYMTFIHINRVLQEYGCQSFPFSNNTPADFVLTVAQDFGINTFSGITSVVLGCLRDMWTSGGQDLKIDKIFYGGEHIYEADRLEMQEKFGTQSIMAHGYGSVDSWYIGYQCQHCPPGVFHVHDDQIELEIIDPDTGAHVAEENVGQVFVTAFERRLTPIVKYAVGDRAHWMQEPCPCGRHSPRFRLLGRGDDVLRIGYDSIDYEAVQNVVVKHSELTGNVRMSKSREGGKDTLTVAVESRSELSSGKKETLAQELHDQLLADRPSLRGFVEKGQINPVKVQIEKPGALPRNPRTGKLVRVVDAI